MNSNPSGFGKVDGASTCAGVFYLPATTIIEFDAQKRGTRFINRCADCNQFEEVVGASPVFLVDDSRVDDMGFARTDLEFGSGDEKSPVLICGDAAAETLRQAALAGLDLEKV